MVWKPFGKILVLMLHPMSLMSLQCFANSLQTDAWVLYPKTPLQNEWPLTLNFRKGEVGIMIFLFKRLKHGVLPMFIFFREHPRILVLMKDNAVKQVDDGWCGKCYIPQKIGVAAVTGEYLPIDMNSSIGILKNSHRWVSKISQAKKQRIAPDLVHLVFEVFSQIGRYSSGSLPPSNSDHQEGSTFSRKSL